MAHLLLAPLLAAAALLGGEARLEAEVFNEPTLPDALRRARQYAGEDGFVASLPQLLHARATAPYGNDIWNNWYSTTTEEYAFFSPEGEKVVVVVHGGGVFRSAERFAQMYKEDDSGMTQNDCPGLDDWPHGNAPYPCLAARITIDEAHDLLNGKLPGGKKLPIYPWAAFKEGIDNLPQEYGVLMTQELANKSANGYAPIGSLYGDALFAARAGGVKHLAAYLDRVKGWHHIAKYGTWHPYNRIDFSQPQGRVVFLAGNKGGRGTDGSGDFTGYGEDYGIGGDASIRVLGRYVAVREVDESSAIGGLPFALGHMGGRHGMRAQSVWAQQIPIALREAQLAAGSAGWVATLPELMHARMATTFGDDIWSKKWASLSEESIVKSADGSLLVVTVHGGGVLSSPQRISQAMAVDNDYEHMSGDYAAKLTEIEAQDLLTGKMPDGEQIPMYQFTDFARGVPHLPRRYGVITPFHIANASAHGVTPLKAMHRDPMLIVHAGGAQAAAAYVRQLARRQSTMKTLHDYHALFRAHVPSCNVLYLSPEGGVLAADGVVDTARFVVVAPEDKSKSIRLLDYKVPAEKPAVPEIMV